jgi:hypothetical protein
VVGNHAHEQAHTIVTITFAQKVMNEVGEAMTKVAVVNLVDLAGSERADSTGASGDRLKEGAKINMSLSNLGNVMKALYLQSISKGKKVNVPFRDSQLTMLLKNALCGNSKTIIAAALSPVRDTPAWFLIKFNLDLPRLARPFNRPIGDCTGCAGCGFQ